MIFWILTAVIVLPLALIVYKAYEFDGLGFSIVIGLLGSFVAFLLWMGAGAALVGISSAMGPNNTTSSTQNLKALGSDSSLEGRMYFLGGGYIDGKRVLSYIQENSDGSFTPNQVDANKSKVFEKADAKPTMTTIHYNSDRWWLIPGNAKLYTWYEFVIPPGSVSETYSVTP